MWRITLTSAYRRSKRERRRHRCGLGHENDTRILCLEPLEQRRLLASDFGDAPNDGLGSLLDYPVTLIQNGARHEIIPGFCLGADVDAESDGQPSAEANADDLTDTPVDNDEDGVRNVDDGGVMVTGGLKRGDAAATLEVIVTNTADVANPYLDAWIDFDADGSWDESDELIVSRAITAGTHTLTFAVPDDAVLGQTYARFRLHAAAAGVPPTGEADAGEVEDHAVIITFDMNNPDQVAKLTADDAVAKDLFGKSVAVSGDTIVVGATAEHGDREGAAYVFTRTDGHWSHQMRLTTGDPTSVDHFGHSVSVSGDTVVVGVDDYRSGYSGATYVFVRSGNSWTQQAKLTAPLQHPSDHQGKAVSVSGDTVVVGSPNYDVSPFNSAGAASVFTRSGTDWTYQAQLIPDVVPETGQNFGFSVSVSGDTVVVGASGEHDETGAAYVFTRSGSSWTQQARLTAADAAEEDFFGFSVSVSGDTVVVGARGDDDNGDMSGSAYVFTRSGSTWTRQSKLTADDAAPYDFFGQSVSVSGDTVVVGAGGDDDNGDKSGSAYVFTRSGSTWTRQGKLTALDAARDDGFGFAVAVSGDTVVAGAYKDDDNGDNSGSAAVFDLDSNLDYGDAPASYRTEWADNGARHVPFGPTLGLLRDAEPDGLASSDATGDDQSQFDDEDELMFQQGQASATVLVGNTSAMARLDGWIDFNGNGNWDDPGEQIFTSLDLTPGPHELWFTVPEDAQIGETFARLRISTAGGLAPTGGAFDGEVEDHVVTIRGNRVLDYSSGNVSGDVTLRRNGDALELFDNNSMTLIDSQPLALTNSVAIRGTDNNPDRLTIDFDHDGYFSLPGGVQFHAGSGEDDELVVHGTGQTMARYVSQGEAMGDASIETSEGTAANTTSFTGVDGLQVFDVLDLNVIGALHVGEGALEVVSGDYTELGDVTTLSGGGITSSSGLFLPGGRLLSGHGAIDAPMAASLGSTITLTGDLTIGDAASFDGFVSDGRLNVGDQTVTLNDRSKAVLGSQTTLGDEGNDGTLNARYGIALGDNRTLVGQGEVNTVDGEFENQGFVQGNGTGITFNDLVTGAGDFGGTVRLDGGYEPGNSPAQIDFFGDVYFGDAGTLTIELGGLEAGTEFDRLDVTDTANLDGILQVDVIDLGNGYEFAEGDRFEIIAARQSVNGTFDEEHLPDLPADLEWVVEYEADSVTLIVSPIPMEGFIVTDLMATPSGFTAHFSRPLDPSDLNLYDVKADTFGPADVTLTGISGTSVTGSLVVDSNVLTFLATGDPLPAGNYTVTLRSATDGLKDLGGELLDGNYDGTPGTDFVNQIAIAPIEPVVISLPDVVRGPSQAVHVPPIEMPGHDGVGGLPVNLTHVGGIQTLEVTLRFNPTLLSITGAVSGLNSPDGATVQFDETGPGEVNVSFSSPTALPAGSTEIFKLTADVPSSATYGAAHVLDIANVTVNGGTVPVTVDDAIHVAAYFGETTGNEDYSGLDAQRAARVAVGLDSGFEAYPAVDPVIIADVTGNGDVSGLDAQRIAQEAVGLDPWEIPPLPQPQPEPGFIEMVTVGNPGNAADDTGYGSLDHEYRIGKFEVTAGQYTEFLNAVAADDTYELYNPDMWTVPQACQIQRGGSSGSYVYSVATDRANRPVNYVSWGDAARFANWLHNGQPTGAQDSSTTEDGAYELNGATSQSALMAITRQFDARWFLPTENQWYKAAYYDGADSVYYDYPMGTDSVPNNGNPGGDTGNTANYIDSVAPEFNFAVGSPYWSTPVGHFGLSESPYGTFDQGGNVWEWNESAVVADLRRGVRGGSWGDGIDGLLASYRRGYDPTYESNIGFRVATASVIGHPLVNRASHDLASGSIFILRDEGAAGSISQFGFYDNNFNGRQITPLIFKAEGLGFTISGIGTTRTSNAGGAQTNPFGLVSGSDQMGLGYALGWKDGSNGSDNAGVAEWDNGGAGLVGWEGTGLGSFAVGDSFGDPWTIGRTYSLQGTLTAHGTEIVGNVITNRNANDGASGSIFILNDPFTIDGYATQWAMYDNDTLGHQITPLLLTPSGSNWELIGVGTTRASDASGAQYFDFGLLSGTNVVGTDIYFGFKDGSNGTNNQGVADYDDTSGGPQTIWLGDGKTSFGVGDTFGAAGSLDRTYSIEAFAANPAPAPSTLVTPMPQEAMGLIPVKSSERVETPVFQDLTLKIVDLPGDLLGFTHEQSIQIDFSAPGYERHFDTTPWDNDEYTLPPRLSHALRHDRDDVGFTDDGLPLTSQQLPYDPLSDLDQSPFDELEDLDGAIEQAVLDQDTVDRAFAVIA